MIAKWNKNGLENPLVEVWDVENNKAGEFYAEYCMYRLREERDKLLLETDWCASSDLTITQEQKDYRQALRDLPETASPELDSDGNLTGVTWPPKPA